MDKLQRRERKTIMKIAEPLCNDEGLPIRCIDFVARQAARKIFDDRQRRSRGRACVSRDRIEQAARRFVGERFILPNLSNQHKMSTIRH